MNILKLIYILSRLGVNYFINKIYSVDPDAVSSSRENAPTDVPSSEQ